MIEKIRWGIVGTGRIARLFAHALSLLDDAELVAVASRSNASLDRFTADYPVPHGHVGYENLATDPDVDVVYIATPHAMHKDNALMCLSGNKAVLCEKPFTLNAREAETVIGLAREKNLFLMEAMWTRFIPAVVRLRELLASGRIGGVRMLIAGGGFIPEFDPDFYLFNHALGGGVLLDAGVYLVSMSSMVLGTPENILAQGQLGETGVDEHDAILLGHGNGALANLYVSLRVARSPDVTLLGEKGSIYLHPPVFRPDRLTVSVDGEEEIIELPFAPNGYQFQIEEVHRCIRDGKTESGVMPLDETLHIMHTMDEIRRQFGLRYAGE